MELDRAVQWQVEMRGLDSAVIGVSIGEVPLLGDHLDLQFLALLGGGSTARLASRIDRTARSVDQLGNVVTRQNGFVNIIPGDVITASYVDADTGFYPGFIPPFNSKYVVQTTASTQQPYALLTSTTPSTGLSGTLCTFRRRIGGMRPGSSC